MVAGGGAEGKVVVRKMLGSENPADLMTMFLGRSEVVDRLQRMGLVWEEKDVG